MRHIVRPSHHGSVTLVDVACLVTLRSGGAVFGIVARLLLCGGQLGLGELRRATLGGQTQEIVKFAETQFVCRVCAGETQERRLSEIVHETQELDSFDNSGMTMTLEQVVTQLQQDVFTLKAQVADESGVAGAVRAINNLATAQGKKDTPRLIGVNGLGRPKEFP